MEANQEGKRDSTSPDSPHSVVFKQLAEGDFHRRLAATPGIAAVLFSAPHCGACRAWKRLLPEALAGISDALYEVDVGDATGVARCYGIFHLPTIYLYRDGRFHAELQCEARPGSIRTMAHSLLEKPAQDEP